MGCASSTPMIQTTGSEMLKAATHVAADATQTAEDAVEGLKDSVGKSLENAKDSVAARVENVKHEVENVVKEKTEMVGDAANSLMEKLHLKPTENKNGNQPSNENIENIVETEANEVKTKLNENLKHSNAMNDALAERFEGAKGMKEHVMSSIDTEADSLKTSTPEPEIEQALAKSIGNREGEIDNPPTPQPTLAELENLNAELLKQSIQQDNRAIANDIAVTNDPLMSGLHGNIRTVDGSNMMSLTADSSTIKRNESTTIAPTSTSNDNKSTNMQLTAQTGIAPGSEAPFKQLAFATSSMATATAAVTAITDHKPVKNESSLRKTKAHKKEEKVVNYVDKTCEEKRPGTTEWEKYADMLAQTRKSHNMYRNSTLTKFGVHGIGQSREHGTLGHHMRNVMDIGEFDTPSNFRGSNQNSRRSSPKQMNRMQRLANRPNTSSYNRQQQELYVNNVGGNYAQNKMPRNSSHNTPTGRTRYYNHARSRINDFVSSTHFLTDFLQNTASTPMPYAPKSHSYELVKSPSNMRSHYPRSDMVNLPPLDFQERTKTHSQQEATAQDHYHYLADCIGNFPIENHTSSANTPILTRQSSNNSLFSKSSHVEKLPTLRASNSDARPQQTIQPPVKNTSSFLTTPRNSSFSLTKSYTDLYFSTTSNKENKLLSSKSPFKVCKNLNVSTKKPSIK